jgi:hypothetical protein
MPQDAAEWTIFTNDERRWLGQSVQRHHCELENLARSRLTDPNLE